MPMVHMHYPAGSLTKTQKADLAERFTHVLLEIEGGQDTPAGRAIAWVMFTEVAQDDWAIGGKFDDTFVAPPGKFLVYVTVPEGSMGQDRKTRVHQAVDEALHAALGTKPAAGFKAASTWVIVQEVADGHWGAHGRTFHLKDISRWVGGDLDSPIRQRSTKYLEARAASRAHFGFPG